MHHEHVPRRRLLVAALLLAAVGGVLAAPAGASDTVLSGTIAGADGKNVSALIGFDLRDDAGRQLAASGCVESPSCPVDGYAITKRINFELGPYGNGDDDRWTDTWSVRLPEEASRVYVEVYPQGARYAGTDMRRYGASFRRNLPLPYPVRVNLRLPLVCEPAGGGPDGAGMVNGYAVDDGRRVPLKRVTAFSLEPDNNRPTPVLGTGTGQAESNGYYKLDNLASGVGAGQSGGQRYQLVATAVDGRVRRVYDVRIGPCGRLYRNIDFSPDSAAGF
ncbi:MAG: hypothetical protein JWM64_2900 [Frankiales bacterium]|nr:hypothetical protein [Frankiales bacterium]